MKHRDMDHALSNATTDIAWLRDHHLEHAIRNLDTWIQGHSYPGGTGTGNSGGGHGDPVAALVERTLAQRESDNAEIDRLRRERAIIEDAIETIRLAAERARSRVLALTATKHTSRGPETCRLCALVGSTTAIYAELLCRWCYDLSQRLGRDDQGARITPHTDLVRMHNQGRKVHTNTIRNYHPSVDQAPVEITDA